MRPREGHDVTIAYGVRPETPDELRERIDPAVDVIELPWEGRTVSAQVRAARALRRLCRERRPDVIHLHSSFAGGVGAIAIAGMAPTIYTPHAYSFLGARSRLRRALYTGGGDLRRPPGDHGRGGVRVTRRVSRASSEHVRVEVIPNGVPELDHPPPARPTANGHPTVVAMGRIVPQRLPVETARILASVADIAMSNGSVARARTRSSRRRFRRSECRSPDGSIARRPSAGYRSRPCC